MKFLTKKKNNFIRKKLPHIRRNLSILKLSLFIFFVRAFGSLKQIKKKGHKLEFKREKLLRKNGRKVFEDNLIDLKVWEFVPRESEELNTRVKATPKGLTVSISIPETVTPSNSIRLHIDDIIKDVNVKVSEERKNTTFLIRRDTLEVLPKSFGIYLTLEGYCTKKPICAIINSCSDNSDKKLSTIDKKGHPVFIQGNVNANHQEWLRLYSKVNSFFLKELDRPLFLMYGTLLGCYRDNQLIAHDDDFDAGYVSNYQSPSKVKNETIHIMTKLIDAGFIVSINNRGRAFCIWDKSGCHDTRLDIRPVFFLSGKLWAHLQACLDMSKDDILPCKQVKLSEQDVLIPKNSEKFLVENYGKGWKVPDPSYSNKAVHIPQTVKDTLMKYCFTIFELRKLQRKIAKKSREGELIIKPLSRIAKSGIVVKAGLDSNRKKLTL